jgi:hypothetical protein
MSAYRQPPFAPPPVPRRTTRFGARGPSVIAGAGAMLLVGVFYLVLLRDVAIDCARSKAGGGTCDVLGHVVPIDEIDSLELESMTSPTKHGFSVQSRLVLRTQSGRINVERAFSSYIGDDRPEIVTRFNAFLQSDAPRFTSRPYGVLKDVAVLLLASGAAFVAARSRRRRGVTIDLDEAEGELTITDGRGEGAPQVLRIAIVPAPIALIQEVKSELCVCVVQGTTTIPIIACPNDVAARSLLLEGVEAAIRLTTKS